MHVHRIVIKHQIDHEIVFDNEINSKVNYEKLKQNEYLL